MRTYAAIFFSSWAPVACVDISPQTLHYPTATGLPETLVFDDFLEREMLRPGARTPDQTGDLEAGSESACAEVSERVSLELEASLEFGEGEGGPEIV